MKKSIGLFFTYIAIASSLTCSIFFAPAYAEQWTIGDAYNLIETDPEIKAMAFNNCQLWRKRNAQQGLSYYSESYALGAQVSSGVPLSKAVAVGVAAQMWTKKYCPDVW